MSGRLKPLIDALNGLPNERKATALIAMYTVIPVGCVAVPAGAFLAPLQPQWAGIAGAVAGGVVSIVIALGTVYVARWVFGFGGVVRVAEALVGLTAGGFLGLLLSGLLSLGWWPFLLAPAVAVLNLIFRPLARRTKPPPPAEPLQPGEWRRKKWD